MTEPQAGPVTAGGLLRAAREKQGLHIAALAAAIKVSQRKLEALEADRHDDLPDATFVRALAQTVCRTLKVDARQVLELLPPAPSVVLVPGSGGLGTPFRERPGRIDPSLGLSQSLGAVRPLAWAGAFLAAAALAVYLLPADLFRSVVLAPSAEPVLPAAAPASAPAWAAVAGTSAAASGAASTEAIAAPVATASQPMVETVFSAPPPAAASPGEPAGTAPQGLLQVRTTEASWVEVRDARGQLLMARAVQPGESVGLDGSLPLRLVIGNAAATQLGFRGKPVDLAASTRDNVARVELR